MRDEGLYLPNCQTNLVIVLHVLSLLLWHFIMATAFKCGRYKTASLSTKEVHGYTIKTYKKFQGLK